MFVRELGGKADGLELIPRDNRVVALDLTANGLTAAALKKLAAFKHLPHLRELGLIVNNLTDTAVKVLKGAAFFQKLSLIRLAGNPLSPGDRDKLRDHFGDRVSFEFDRDPDRLYTIRDDYLSAGWCGGHTQMHVYLNLYALFDHAGTLLETGEKKFDVSKIRGAFAEIVRRRQQLMRAWCEEQGWVSATIKVKRFEFPSGEGLTPFNWWAEECDGGTAAERRENADRVRRWLDDGKYRYTFGAEHDAWFDRDGEVTDT